MQSKEKQRQNYLDLDISEILQCMDELNIPFNENELLKPNLPTVIRIYEFFLEMFTGATKDSWSNPNFEALEILEHPEIHQESISQMCLFRAM